MHKFLRQSLPLLMFSAGCQILLSPDPNLFLENTRPHCRDSADNDGDGRIDCDDDECRAICLCGNRVLDEGEQCDDGDLNGSGGCDLDCQRVGVCGDGVLDPGEECDLGDIIVADGCRPDCTAPKCGDGIRDFGEACDDGNNLDGDGCDPSCQLEIPASCGDDIIDDGEECDDGDLNSDTTPNACRSNCKLASCGDLVLDDTERCDDGNQNANDGCSGCLQEFCGDGVAQSDPNRPEGCDDGNVISGDGCSSGCLQEFCGDGIINNNLLPGAIAIPLGEQCDDGNQSSGDGCSNSCNLEVIIEQEPNEDGTPSPPASQPVETGNDFDASAIQNANSNGAIQNGNLSGAINPLGDEDVFAIKNTRVTSASLSLRTASNAAGTECNSIDTFLVLRSELGEVLSSNDNLQNSLCAAIPEFVMEPNQLVYAHVLASGDNVIIQQYFLRVTTAR